MVGEQPCNAYEVDVLVVVECYISVMPSIG